MKQIDLVMSSREFSDVMVKVLEELDVPSDKWQSVYENVVKQFHQLAKAEDETGTMSNLILELVRQTTRAESFNSLLESHC